MKKLLILAAMLSSGSLYAQEWHRRMHEELMHGFIIMLLFILIVYFVLTFLQRILDHRLKNKIIDKGITDTLASSLLKNNPKESTQSAMKWACLLGATGAGLIIVYNTMPLHIHSLATMAFSIAVGFLGYYFFLKQSDR